MTDATLPTMHPDFPRWYREVSVEENRDRLQRRWIGVMTIHANLNKVMVGNLLRIVFRAKGGAAPEAITQIRKAFKDADDLFDMDGNDREIEVLSGSILAVALERSDDLSAWTAIAITTSAFNGNRTLQLPLNLLASAENAIARVAEKNRDRPNLQGARLAAPKLVFTKAKEKLTTIDAAGIGATFDVAAEAINLTLTTIVNKINSSITATANFIAIQDEELNMLWWVLGERSDGLKQPFSAVPEKARPLVFGAELAEATNYLPGPLSIEGLLTRAGLKANNMLTIPDAVNACEKSWLESFSDGIPIASLCQPIHLAIQRKRETEDESAWISGWAGSCGVDAALTIPALSLGKLFYRERLLSLFGEE
jgi:hypothetical protein